MIFKRAKKEPEAAPPMGIEDCKKLIHRDYVYEKMKPEFKRLVDAKDKAFAAALLKIACVFDAENWINYNFGYVLPACIALKVIGDASIAGPILEFLDANHERDDYQNPFQNQIELLDALVAAALWGPYRDLLERLAAYGGNLGKFGAEKIAMLEAAQEGKLDRIEGAAKALAGDSSEMDFAEALSFLEADRSGLALRRMLFHSSAFGWMGETADIVDAALGRIPDAAIPVALRMRLELYDTGRRNGLVSLLEKFGAPAAPALIALMKDEKDIEAYEALKKLFAAGRMRTEDKEALLSMKGMTLRVHSDNTTSCGVHLDTPGVDVEL